jgi:hypothetical protein
MTIGPSWRLAPLLLGFLGSTYAQSDPFTRDQRLQWYVHRTYDWHRMLYLAADTGFDQLLQSPDVWGRGTHRFARRYSSGFGRRVIRNSMELGLGAALGEDIRYRPSRTGSLKGRLLYAVMSSVRAPVPGGYGRPLYSRFAAAFGTEMLAATWHPCAVSPQHLLRNGGFAIMDQVGNNSLTEFEPELKNFGRRVGRTLLRPFR